MFIRFSDYLEDYLVTAYYCSSNMHRYKNFLSIHSTNYFFLSNIQDYLDTYSYICHSLDIVVCLISLISQYSFAQSQMCVYMCSVSRVYIKTTSQKEKKVITLSIINEFVYWLQLLINTYDTQERLVCACVSMCMYKYL